MDIAATRPQLRAAASSLRRTLRELEEMNLKDDIAGEHDSGTLGAPDDDLNFIDDISSEPPGAGSGEDNAGRR